MLERIMPTARYARIALSAAALTAMACNDATGPGGEAPPGRQLLAAREFAQWTWAPSGNEVVFSTRFDAPYTGPPARLDAITVPGGSRRTVVTAPSNGDRIIGYRFVVVGSHVYYEVSHPSSSDEISFYRAPLDGRSPPEKVIDVAPYNVSVSPDERTVAWMERDQATLRWSLVTTDIATRERRAYPLQHHADRVHWSPSGRSVVVESGGTPLQWVELAGGTVRVWLETVGSPGIQSSLDIGWGGESPLVYVAGVDVARYSMATGAREVLSTLPMPGHAIGWSRDFETLIIESNECLQWGGGFFGSSCTKWTNRVDRIPWRSGVRTRVLHYDGAAELFGRAAPAGAWLGYVYCRFECQSPDDGLYIERIP